MTPRLREGVSITRTDFGLVLLDEQAGEYFQLNEAGAVVAEGLAAQHSAHDIATQLVREYEVDLDQARADVNELIKGMLAANLAVS